MSFWLGRGSRVLRGEKGEEREPVWRLYVISRQSVPPIHV